MSDDPRMPSICFGDPEQCTYCGEQAKSVDHVIPISFWLKINRKFEKEANSKGIITFACKDCNCKLSDKMFESFRHRIDYIQGIYLKKAKRNQGKAEWDDKEIAKLDHTLRTYVASMQEDMRKLDRQTTWIESIAFRRLIKELKYSSYIDPMSHKYLCWVREYFVGFV